MLCFRDLFYDIGKVINLDPAAETFGYECHGDIRELISLTDVMEELELGPNGVRGKRENIVDKERERERV